MEIDPTGLTRHGVLGHRILVRDHAVQLHRKARHSRQIEVRRCVVGTNVADPAINAGFYLLDPITLGGEDALREHGRKTDEAARRLNAGRFVWPTGGGQVGLSREQLDALVLGLPWQMLGDAGIIRVI
mgnify:CR=1 FL=1